jgi:hypothetical protein
MKKVIIEVDGGKLSYPKWQYNLAWFLAWAFGVIFGAIIF